MIVEGFVMTAEDGTSFISGISEMGDLEIWQPDGLIMREGDADGSMKRFLIKWAEECGIPTPLYDVHQPTTWLGLEQAVTQEQREKFIMGMKAHKAHREKTE